MLPIEDILTFLGGGSAIALGVIKYIEKVSIVKITAKENAKYEQLLEKEKAELKLKFDQELEVIKSDIKHLELKQSEKWKLKREACLEALDITDSILSHISKKSIKDEVDTIRVRKCYNRLACTIDNSYLLELFKKSWGFKGEINFGIISELRDEVRKELDFGYDSVDLDKDTCFLAVAYGDSKIQTEEIHV